MKNKKLKIDIVADEQIVGSTQYTISVNVTNISGKDIHQLDVFPTHTIGQQLTSLNEIENVELSELEEKKNKIINEMQKQIDSAYERNQLNSLNTFQKFVLLFVQVIDIYAGMFGYLTGKKTVKSTPTWAIEALKIDDWEDVERIEHDVMGKIEEDRFLKRAFLINKDKLKRIIDKINLQSELGSSNELNKGFTLAAGETLTFPFSFKAPHLLKSKVGETQFKTSYKESENGTAINSSITQKIKIYPSAFAVPTGSMLGSICGYLIKLSLISSNSFTQINWSSMSGSILLGLLVALVTARKSNTTKAITVEDFLGGFIIGSLTGLFSENFLDKLKILIQ
ncbi:hypothetical protein ACYCS5_03495 [Paenibacillus sp. SEL3]